MSSQEPNQASLPFEEGAKSTFGDKKMSLRIGGDIGPNTKYFSYDKKGNIRLPDSFDQKALLDPWWGLSCTGCTGDITIVGRTQTMLELFHDLTRFGGTPAWILLTGKTGSGKELAAQVIANVWGGPFIPVNCDVPDGGVSFEDIMFGRKGKVLMGADEMDGVFQQADGGILFLDNVDCLAIHLQSKLLRVLQSKNQVVHKVGSSKGDSIDVRIVSATNQDIGSLVKESKFRIDLYYRIKVIKLNLPPLAARKEDIPLLTVYLLLTHCGKYGRVVTGISRAALEKLHAHTWPGNVRELENAVIEALARGKEVILQPNDFNLVDVSGHMPDVHTHQTDITDSLGGQNRTRRRRKEILEHLRKAPGLTTKDLSKLEDCPLRSIQRDLYELRKSGQIKDKEVIKDGHVNRYCLAKH